MEERYQNTPQSAGYDYQAYDRIWQRVAPDLDPYPEVRNAAQQQNGLLELPGAQSDPCCMGTQAMEDIAVIRGFIEEEQKHMQIFSRFARCTQERKTAAALRKIAESAGEHLRQLLAVHYLVTGECYTRKQYIMTAPTDSFCAALRQAYHEKACGGYNYLRAADATGDPCLQKIFRSFGEEELSHAQLLLKLLSRRMGQ